MTFFKKSKLSKWFEYFVFVFEDDTNYDSRFNIRGICQLFITIAIILFFIYKYLLDSIS